MIALPATILLYAISCGAGPTCAALPLRGFASWGACQDARDAAKTDPAVIAACIRPGAETNEPVE